MPCYWSTNADVVRARFECLAWSHESLLIVRLRPAWANSLNRDLDLVAESRAQRSNFVRTGYDSIDSRFYAQFGESHDLIVDFAGDSNLAQRLFG